MPATRLAFSLTRAYQEQARLLVERAQAVARLAWRTVSLDDLDATFARWLDTTVTQTAVAQRQAAQLAGGYLRGYLSAELEEPVDVEPVDASGWVGRARDGRLLRDALPSALVAVKAQIGRHDPAALRAGERRAVYMVGMAVDHVSRQALAAGIKADPRIRGYRRAVKGTCGACLGAASRTYGDGEDFQVHPGCRCVQEPVVDGARDRFPRPTGKQIFEAMTAAEQDKAVGPKVAAAVRSGAVTLAALVGESELAEETNFISQAPASAG